MKLLMRSLLAVLAILFAAPRPSAAHWMSPEEIVAGLHNNTGLRDSLGVFDVQRDQRLLIIRVIPAVWNTAPVADRLRLAGEWWEVWRHNVASGIVAVVDARNDAPLVNYDGAGHPSLIESTKR